MTCARRQGSAVVFEVTPVLAMGSVSKSARLVLRAFINVVGQPSQPEAIHAGADGETGVC